MGIEREDIKTFSRLPIKRNIYQELHCIKKLSFRSKIKTFNLIIMQTSESQVCFVC